MSRSKRIRVFTIASAVLAGRDAPLYHRAPVQAAEQILAENKIRASTVNGAVSLTRNRHFAENFRGGGVIFVLDQAKLTQRHKLRPIDWFNGYNMNETHKLQMLHERARNEAEERIEGDLDNLDQYLVQVYLDPESLNAYLPSAYLWPHEYDALTKHPKFNDKQRQAILEATKDYREVTAGRDAPLYHATFYNAALNILKDNTIKGGDSHWNETENSEYQQPGVSLTRDKRFAERWAPVVFVLNQSSMAQAHKIIPRDYYHNEPYEDNFHEKDHTRRAQNEEFLPGNLTNLDRHLLEIYIRPSIAHDFASGHLILPLRNLKALETFLEHPKFNAKQKEMLLPMVKTTLLEHSAQ